MPQADLLAFTPTLLFLPVTFLVGYFFFVTVWVPRVLLTLKARWWLTRVHHAVLLGGLVSTDGWPELFLMFVQFGALLYFLSTLSLVTLTDTGLQPLSTVTRPPVLYSHLGGAQVENFFHLWCRHRGEFLYAAAASALSHTVTTALNGFSFFHPGKQFPLLSLKLKQQLRSPRLVG